MKIKRYISLNDEKKESILFLICWAIYFCIYTGRLNYSAAMVQMVNDGFVTKASGGLIATFFFAAYGFGQTFMGVIGDRVSSFKMLLCGTALSSLCNFFMPVLFHGSVTSMCIIWGINGIAQSIMWSPIIRIISQALSPERRFKASIHIITAGPAGTLFTYILSTVLLKYFGWKSVFYSAGIIISTAFAVLLIYFVSSKKDFISEEIKKNESKPEKPYMSASGNGKMIFGILLILLLPVVVHGMLKDSITAWFPVYLSETHGMTPYMAVMLTAVMPAFNLAGIYFAKWIYGKTKSNEFFSCGILFAICACGLGFMSQIGKYNIYLAIIFAAVGTASMSGVNCIAVSVLPVHFGKMGFASTLTGVLNSAVYAGCSVSMAASGQIVEKYGWAGIIYIWCIFSALGVLLCASLNKIWLKTKNDIIKK
ncbi:MAG: MFS transporter [Oscillospiraceae bacterium]|nr:MFS transporter [Oscillospiraceae bacterium]